jgi:hypothetical protein
VNGATAATITSAGVINACAPFTNPPIPDALLGIPAAFITKPTRTPGERTTTTPTPRPHPITARRKRISKDSTNLLIPIALKNRPPTTGLAQTGIAFAPERPARRQMNR